MLKYFIRNSKTWLHLITPVKPNVLYTNYKFNMITNPVFKTIFRTTKCNIKQAVMEVKKNPKLGTR